MSSPKLQVNGADVMVNELKRLEVDTIFCITGAGNLAIVDALLRDGSFQIIYSHHEQAAVMEAQGYSRVSGKIGVALVTTGGGTSNAVTGVLSAHLDSIPLLIISGNESSFHCLNKSNLRAYGVQGFDSVAVLSPISKYSIRIQNTNTISQTVQEAISCATSNRKGPTHIDFPMDLQRMTAGIQEKHVQLHTEFISDVENSYKFINELQIALESSKRPLLYLGNGLRYSPNIEQLKNLIIKHEIPFILSWSAIDLFSDIPEFAMGRVGIYGDRASNIILQKSDLLISIGTRLAIPQIGYDKLDFARHAQKFIVDIDPTECDKFSNLGWNVLNDSASNFLEGLIKVFRGESIKHLSWGQWVNDGKVIWSKFPRIEQVGPEVDSDKNYIHSAQVVDFLNQNLDDDAIVVTDVGAGLLTGHYLIHPKTKQRIFTSQGLGEMGFGLPGAIGAHFARRNSQLICLNTDGAMMFNLQELQVVREHKIPLKLFIFNNLGYSMIRISQENLFDSRLAGSTLGSGISFPRFNDVAKLFNFSYTQVSAESDLNAELLGKLKSNESVIIEIMMSPEQKYLPRLATNKMPDGSLISPPLEDLDPKLELSTLEKALGYKAHPNSYALRGLSNE
jgi:acetolactate synthase-1/2/3 large subunit